MTNSSNPPFISKDIERNSGVNIIRIAGHWFFYQGYMSLRMLAELEAAGTIRMMDNVFETKKLRPNVSAEELELARQAYEEHKLPEIFRLRLELTDIVFGNSNLLWVIRCNSVDSMEELRKRQEAQFGPAQDPRVSAAFAAHVKAMENLRAAMKVTERTQEELNQHGLYTGFYIDTKTKAADPVEP